MCARCGRRARPNKSGFSAWNQRLPATLLGMAQTLQRQIVSRARAIIADEVNWTSKALARDSSGMLCELDSARATKFCALGALVRAASEMISDEYVAHSFAMEAAQQILEASRLAGSCLPMLNDSEGHASVLAMFDRALDTSEYAPAKAVPIPA
jgi:hypothetical protein